ncbi:hypothetical protein A5761_09910 [Mycolicibacterium setense]|nr:hypothetical protein A5761_09910 [Mycolicibacterium setense]
MSLFAARVGLVTATVAIFLASEMPLTANASEGDWGINGTFIATSNGDYAKTNDLYRNEVSVRQTWSVTTTCVNPTDCVGNVTSDQGWNAPIYQKSGIWYVKRAVPRWEPCPDGTTADGLQMFRFFPADPVTGEARPMGSNAFLGEDITKSASGSCGISKQLYINMPFKLIAV